MPEEFQHASSTLQAATARVQAEAAPVRLAHVHHHASWLAFVDGAIFEALDLVGFGLAIEDAEGNFSLAVSGYEEGGTQAAVAEALALRHCLLYASDSLLNPDCVFTDCQSLYFAINSSCEDNSAFGLLVSDCKTLLASRPDIQVFWIRRQENRCAQLLARNSIRHGKFRLWVDMPDLLFGIYPRITFFFKKKE